MTGRRQCLSSLLHLLHPGFWGDGGVLSFHCPSNMLKEPRANHQGVPGQLLPPLGRAAGRCCPGCSSLSDQALQPEPGRTRWASPGEQVSSWSCWVTLTPPPFRHCPISVARLPQPPPGLQGPQVKLPRSSILCFQHFVSYDTEIRVIQASEMLPCHFKYNREI